MKRFVCLYSWLLDKETNFVKNPKLVDTLNFCLFKQTKNCETLKLIFNFSIFQIQLDRLSLTNFDLITDGELESQQLDAKTRECIRQLAGIGPQFAHLSYTTYSGFNLNCKFTVFMLKRCGVKSIRLTMQKGQFLNEPEPMVPVKPLLNELERLELVGNLTAPRSLLDTVFPKLNYYNYQRQDLATGAPIQPVC